MTKPSLCLFHQAVHQSSQFTESPFLTTNEKTVEQLASAKSLAVYNVQTLNLEFHIKNICNKIAWAALVQLSEFGNIFHLKF